MGTVKAALVTIGQSPREDILGEIQALFLPKLEICEYGLLDGMSAEDLQRMRPGPSELQLVSRLRDGTQVLLGESLLIERLKKLLSLLLQTQRIHIIGMLCSHDFPCLHLMLPVVFPGVVLRFVLQEMLKPKKIGVVVPLEAQQGEASEKWRDFQPVTAVRSPYQPRAAWEKIARGFDREGVEAVLLDCIGYSLADKQELQKDLPVPVLLPRLALVLGINLVAVSL